MTKKLISISLIAVAAMISTAIPSAQGGGYYSYNTTWTMTCSGVPGLNVLGQLNLMTKQGVLSGGSNPAGCSSSDGNTSTDTNTVNTSAKPSSWTWTSTMYGVQCLNLHNKPTITGKFGQSVFYNCISLTNNSLIASGYLTVAAPVGQP